MIHIVLMVCLLSWRSEIIVVISSQRLKMFLYNISTVSLLIIATPALMISVHCRQASDKGFRSEQPPESRVLLIKSTQYRAIFPNRTVVKAATTAQHAPMNKQTLIAFTPSVLWCSSSGASLSSGLFPGSSNEKTTNDIPVPTNWGSVV